MTHKLIPVFLGLLLPLAVFAQTIPVNPKYGAISQKELEMDYYPLDTAAVAVMLYHFIDYKVDVSATGQFSFTKTVRERIKVLKESGKEYGDYELFYSTDNDLQESVSGIKVTTYNLEDGKTVPTKMGKEFVFKEEYTDKINRVAFSAQNVRIGSVIETEYTTRSLAWEIDDIFFQFEIPVNSAGADVAVPEYLKFNRMSHGSERVDYSQDERNAHVNFMGGGDLTYNVTVDRFRCADIPAIRNQSYCYDLDQYRVAVLYQIRCLDIPGAVYKEYSANWGNVDNAIKESRIVRNIKQGSRFKEEVAPVMQTDAPDYEKIAAIRDIVASHVHWNDKDRLVPDTPAEVIKKGNGSSADLNALTGSALREAGYTVEPVMVRKRTHGAIFDFHVALDAYNVFILKVTAPDGKAYYLDASRKEGYVNVLPDNLLVEKARLIHLDGQGEWISLRQNTPNQIMMTVNATLDEDGLLKAQVAEKEFNECSYTMKRNRNKADDEDDFIEQIETTNRLDITEVTIEGADTFSSSFKMQYSVEKQQEAGGDRIYVRPFLIPFHDKTTFSDEDRKIPVEFPFPYRITYGFTLTLPEGYVVEQMPSSLSAKAAEIASSAIMQCRQLGDNQVMINFAFKLDTYLVPSQLYKDLRAWWDQLSALYESTIVLKKQ